MLKVKNRQTTKREFGRTHVTQIIEKFGTAQFGTKIKKRTIRHQDNLEPKVKKQTVWHQTIWHNLSSLFCQQFEIKHFI